jgi:3-oxoacyl-[acyl-carrier-protein] synthase II
MKRRVVITGLGTINPLGNNVESTWKSAKEGKNGIDYIKRFDTQNIDVKIAGEVKDFDFLEYFGKKQIRRIDRFTQLAVIASDEAIEDSKLDLDTIDKTRVGVYYSSGIGGLETIAEQEDKAVAKGHNRISPFFIPMSIINIAPGTIAIKYGFKGMATASVTACASATNTIGDAFRSIRDGYLDFAITGGSEASITELGLSGFKVMQALSNEEDPNKASTPFDLNRSGFVMGEGAATLVLETLEHAQARNAHIYAEIVGYGATCDANHITSPDPLGEGAKNCMHQAVLDAGLTLEDVGYINAHGTSTPLNDKTETLAISRLFVSHAKNISISSTKSMTGHLLGASGALEAVFSVLALKDGFIPPTINYQTFDPECDLDYTVNKGKERIITVALSNSLGFGGHNATLAFRKWDA